MTGRARRVGALCSASALALAFGVVLASAASTDTDDHYKPANTTVKSSSTKVVVSGSGITMTCTHSSTSGKAPATGLGLFTITPPTFNDGGTPTKPCTDSVGGKDTITTSGTWRAGFVDVANDEPATEPNTGDRFKLIIPKDGVVDHNSFGCTVTVAPNGPVTVVGAYNDVNKLTINVKNAPVLVSGPSFCSPGTATGSLQATYTLSPGLSDAS